MRFVELCITVATDGNLPIRWQLKMTVHIIGFVELCTAVTADGDISNQATEVKMTIHLPRICINIC